MYMYVCKTYTYVCITYIHVYVFLLVFYSDIKLPSSLHTLTDDWELREEEALKWQRGEKSAVG